MLRWTESVAEEARGSGNQPIGERTCPACGKTYRPHPRARRSKFCSRECGNRFRNPPPVPTARPCEECGTLFTPHKNVYTRARFCSDQCRSRYTNRHRKPPDPEQVRDYSRRHHLRKKFGMSMEDYDAMLREQGGGCAICKTTDTAPWKCFCVDHDHDTGEVRGLLCPGCNRGIGGLRDDPELLRRALAYLEPS